MASTRSQLSSSTALFAIVVAAVVSNARFASAQDPEIVATENGINFVMKAGQKIGYQLGDGAKVYFNDYPSQWQQYTSTMFSAMQAGFTVGNQNGGAAGGSGCNGEYDKSKPLGLPMMESLSWNEIENRAVGGTVNFWMWNGVGANRWVTQWLAPKMMEKFSIKVNIGTGVPAAIGEYGAPPAVAKVKEESASNPTDGGSVDLIWINGENFKNLKPFAYGPFAWNLPSSSNYNWKAKEIVYDFGTPTEGYEMPYNAAQFVFYYSTSRVAAPPKTIPDVVNWIKANSGRFTYANPSEDFLGGAVVRHFFYYYAGTFQGGSMEDFYGEFNEALYVSRAKAVWSVLNEIEEYLADVNVDGGVTKYPSTHDSIRDMFADGEIWLDGAYDPNHASTQILNGVYSNDTKSIVLDDGSISNLNFVAIPKNAANKYAALVTTNVIASMEGVFTRAQPERWGTLPSYDANKPEFLSSGWDAAFDYIDSHHAVPSVEDLTRTRVPELSASVQNRIHNDWVKCVLNKDQSSDCV